jgi:hypothetical protein
MLLQHFFFIKTICMVTNGGSFLFVCVSRFRHPRRVCEFVPKYIQVYPKVAFLFPRKWIRIQLGTLLDWITINH